METKISLNSKRILVIGGGSWGTSFANYLSNLFKEIRIWVREDDVRKNINENHENHVFLKGIKLNKNLIAVKDLEQEVDSSQILIFAIPSKYIRSIFKRLKHNIKNNHIIINLSKGIESESLLTISNIAKDVFEHDILNQWITFSGPSFAKELAEKNPTAIVSASINNEILHEIQSLFSSEILRIYTSNDLIGVEIGGSLKNIIAIASGMIRGLGYGYNSTASLVTRAMVEISRLGLKLGAKKETFWGLAGIGDLMLTCFGPLSRNFQLGEKIAKGDTLERIQNSTPMIAEGVETTKAVMKLSEKLDLEMPITKNVYKVLFDKLKPEEALKSLMKRSLKREWDIN